MTLFEEKGSLHKIFTALASRNPEQQHEASFKLRRYVEDRSRATTTEGFRQFITDLTARIFRLVNSADVVEQKSGIMSIDALMEVRYDDSEPVIVRFANALRILLQQHNDPTILDLASKTLGHLVRIGESLTVDVVHFEVKQSLEWLQSYHSESRRMAAVMILKELSVNTPTLFNVHVSNFLDHIWTAIRDQKVGIRLKAIEALHACLDDISKRASSWRLECYHKIFKEAQKGFNVRKYKTASSIHGSLLVVGELLQSSSDFLRSRFKEVCGTVLGFANYKDSMVRDTVVSLMPQLAQLSPAAFEKEYLESCLKHLIHTLKKSGERESRESAYLSLGELALVIGDRLSPKLNIIVPLIQNELASSNHKKVQAPSVKVLSCISMLAQAVGPKLTPYMKAIMEEMFNGGLSVPLIDALSGITSNMHSLLNEVQERLLFGITDILVAFGPDRDSRRYKMVTVPLYGCPLSSLTQQANDVDVSHASPLIAPLTPGALPSFSLSGTKSGKSSRKRNASHSERSEKEEQKLLLALNTLGSFNFKGRSLLPYVKEAVIIFLEDSSPKVRLAAALTCSKILQTVPPNGKYHHLTALCFSVLTSLITLAIGDGNHTIRLSVLQSFDETFDIYLSHHELVNALFTTLNDEEVQVRQTSIALLGRLSERNPAVILPYMRKLLMRLVTELKQFGLTSQEQEQTCLLIGDVIRACPSLARSYVPSLLALLVKKLKNSKENVMSALLSTIGILSTCSGDEVIGSLPAIIPLIVSTLKNSTSSVRRKAALCTLTQLVSSTGSVIDPYMQYPELLPTILDTLTREPQWSVRSEVYKVLGVLGALDPLTYQYKVENILQQRAENEKEKTKQEKIDRKGGIIDDGSFSLMDESSAVNIFPSMLSNPEDFFPTVAIASLVRILKEPTLIQYHPMVVKAVMFIFKSLGMRCVPYLPQIVPLFLEEMRICDASLRENMFVQLASLVTIVKQHMRNYLGEIFELVSEFWDHRSLLPSLLQLVEELSLAVRDEFRNHLGELIPQMMTVLNNDSSPNHQNSLLVMKSIRTFSSNGSLEEYLYVIILELLRLTEQIDSPLAVQMDALRTIIFLSRSHDISEYASRLLHSFMRILSCPLYSLHSLVVAVICVIVNQLGPAFSVFEPMVTRSLTGFRMRSQSNKDSDEMRVYNKYVMMVTSMRQNIELKQNWRRTDWPLNPTASSQGMPDKNPNLQQLPSASSPINRPTSFSNEPVDVELEEILDTFVGSLMEGIVNELVNDTVNNADSMAGFANAAHNRLHVSQQNLKRAWESSQRSTPEDWIEWRRGFSIELLKESPSPALRACSALAMKYGPLARVLFNAAFLSCWGELYDTYQDDLIRSLETALNAKHIPAKVIQALLNLVEFMEHVDKPLPIDVETLGNLSGKWHMYAKALHYKEMQFVEAPERAIDDLISINIMLQQPDAAVGILEYAQNHLNIELKESWYEKLERWGDALEAYERKQLEQPHSEALTLGRLRCLRALGDWDRLTQVNAQLWNNMKDNHNHSGEDDTTRFQIAHLGFIASWNIGEWQAMQEFVSAMDEHTYKGRFGRAVLAIKKEDFEAAKKHIEIARQQLDIKLTALVREGYKRCYNAIVRIQQLKELEEVIVYKQSGEMQRKALRDMWSKRLKGCKEDVDVWQKILTIRSLVMTPQESLKDLILYSRICRKNGRLALSLRVLTSLLGMDPMDLRKSEIGDQNPHVIMAALRYLFSAGFHQDAFERLRELLESQVFATDDPEIRQLKSLCYVKLGDWQLALMNEQHEQEMAELANRRIGDEEGSDSEESSPFSTPSLSPSSTMMSGHDDRSFADAASYVGNPLLSPPNRRRTPTHNTSPSRVQRRSSLSTVVAGPRILHGEDHVETRRRRSVTFQGITSIDPPVQMVPLGDSEPTSPKPIFLKVDTGDTDDSSDAIHPRQPIQVPQGRDRERDRDDDQVSPRQQRSMGQVREGEEDKGEEEQEEDDEDGNLSDSSIQMAVNRAVAMTEKGRESPESNTRPLYGNLARKRNASQESLRGGSPRVGSPKLHKRYLSRPSICVINNYDQVRHQALASYFNATLCDQTNFRAWHAWAVMNFRVVSHYFKTNQKSVIESHLTPAIQAFFKSISLQSQGDNRSLQDILRLLTLWFEHGHLEQVQKAVIEGFDTVSVDTWLAVIPQIIARIDTPHNKVRELVHGSLSKIGKLHPQALVFPLIVSSKSRVASRKTAACDLLNILKEDAPILVSQAFLVSEELIRVAILWDELWQEGIEGAFREIFAKKNVEKAIEMLLPLHEQMRAGPCTIKEQIFLQTYGADLEEAEQWIRVYIKTRNREDLNRATHLYHAVLRKVAKEISTIADSPLEMSAVSKELHTMVDLRLAVPGTYAVGKPLVRISYFIPTVTVIESKQHPRRLSLMGSDGRLYSFLLKGHEDLRQDERVMQLFGLVNTLLANDRETSIRNLGIHRYEVIPLSPNSGLAEWVPHCDTIHALIKQYRESQHIMLNVEQTLMLRMCPDYQRLLPLQKVEVFENALSHTTGQDLSKVLWMKSQNAEVWLEKRTNYTRSLAVMSMVGYILGLGDRHTCNIMINRISGKVVHIDFGDCFEVAMHRDKYPEKIPFRLTRMLIRAMEVSGIEGNFQSTCESVMFMLRENKESVMAVLEAFVYDPLINWRLTQPNRKKQEGDPEERHGSHSDGNESGSGNHGNSGHSNEIDHLVIPTSGGGGNHSGSASNMDASGNRLNQRALQVIRRVEDKLTGKDFGHNHILEVHDQVGQLISQATSHENLCLCYMGWCPFW